MKTKQELNALKEEVETVSKKLHELTEEELAQVSGGGELPGGPTFDGVFPGNTITAEDPHCAPCTVGSVLYNKCTTRTDAPSSFCKFNR